MRYVEVTGAGFVNKGAELMLRAAVEACATSGMDLGVVAGLRTGTFQQRSSVGVRHALRFGGARWSVADDVFVTLTRGIPKAVRSRAGLVHEDEVTAVLDASGFAYSDQWGPRIGKANARHLHRWKRPGRSYIMLPQAFGPFEDPVVRTSMLELLDLADLVFARDKVSLEHLRAIGGRFDHVHLAPDFTNLLMPPSLSESNRVDDHVVFVPNARMVDKGAVADATEYVRNMSDLIRVVTEGGWRAVVLAHEANDVAVARQISESVVGVAPLLLEKDPLRIKALLSRARLVVSSRFHALVSALSQGVPAVSVGWSHKYLELLNEYDAADCLGTSLDPGGDLSAIILRELSSDAQEKRRQVLRVRAAASKEHSRQMWVKVFRLLHDANGV